MNKIARRVCIGIGVAAIVIGGRMCMTRVPAGYVAVQYEWRGGIKDEILTQGWHILPPTIDTTLYTIGLEQSYLTEGENGDSKSDESFTASSKEGKSMRIDLTYTYQYQKENVVGVFNRFKGQSGKEVRDNFIKPNIVSWTKEVTAKYAVSDIIGAERASVNEALTEYLSKKFEKYGITVSNASLINVTVDKETKKAINAKITAQQDAQTQEIKNQTAIDKANAKAQAKIIEAEAEAKANKIVSDSITDELLKQKKIDRWDGKLPKVQGSATTAIIDSGDLIADDTETATVKGE